MYCACAPFVSVRATLIHTNDLKLLLLLLLLPVVMLLLCTQNRNQMRALQMMTVKRMHQVMAVMLKVKKKVC
jgi:hypothetical protein